jgi:hypothetical protein
METCALDYAKKTCSGIKEKADVNKKGSTALFLGLLIPTAISPILILLPFDGFIFRIIPATITAIAAICSAWMQLRKPQERWVIYRTAQREIEYEIDQYTSRINDYKGEDRDEILADRISKRALQLHYEWIPIFPKTNDISRINEGK